jgi:hypothetical protein
MPDGTALVGGAHCFYPAPRQPAGPMVWWDLSKGSTGTGFAGHAGLAAALAFTADGTLLVSTGGDDTVRVWDVATREEIGNRKVRCLHRRLALAPDGGGLAIIHNYNGDFVLLDPSAGKKLGKPLEVNGHARDPCHRWRIPQRAPAWRRWVGTAGCASGIVAARRSPPTRRGPVR